MKKFRNKKGFTLAELLIVVAIIAVLVAIAIPVFTTQLEKSKEGTDIANLRSAYAAATVAALTGQVGEADLDQTKTYYYNPNVDGSIDQTGIACGQGTAKDGKADITALTSGVMKYTKGDVKDDKIKITFANGVVKEVAFETDAE